MKRYAFDKYDSGGVRILGQETVWANSYEDAHLKVTQIYGGNFYWYCLGVIDG